MNMNPENPVLFDAHSESYEQALNDSIAFSGLKGDFFVRVKAAYMQDILAAHFGKVPGVDLLDAGRPLLVELRRVAC
jgi:hypothetical protein